MNREESDQGGVQSLGQANTAAENGNVHREEEDRENWGTSITPQTRFNPQTQVDRYKLPIFPLSANGVLIGKAVYCRRMMCV